ncbi:MAG: hypothetical protein HYT86_05810 [candidate division NC10 bacterium]|nr:hypothetical protein [candidate division NC10 bacterium]
MPAPPPLVGDLLAWLSVLPLPALVLALAAAFLLAAALVFFSDWPAAPGGGRAGCAMRAAGYLLMAACLVGLGGLGLAETRAFLVTLGLFLGFGYLVYALRVHLERRGRR